MFRSLRIWSNRFQRVSFHDVCLPDLDRNEVSSYSSVNKELNVRGKNMEFQWDDEYQADSGNVLGTKIHKVKNGSYHFHGPIYIRGNAMYITILLNGHELEAQLSTGSSFTQISTQLATTLGLVANKKLIGSSKIANGGLKIDYLSQAKLSILEIEREIVVKVSPNQPLLLGLDAFVMYNMTLRLKKFYIGPFDAKHNTDNYSFIDYCKLMQSKNVSIDQLTAVEKLPDPNIAYAEQLEQSIALESDYDYNNHSVYN